MRYLLLLLFYLAGSTLLIGQIQHSWKIGPRAGVVSIPYELGSGKTSSGNYVGVTLSKTPIANNNFSFSLDYGKIGNLRLQEMQRSLFVVPGGAVERIDIVQLTNYSFIRLGARVAPRGLAVNRFRFGLEGHINHVASSGQSRFISETVVEQSFGTNQELNIGSTRIRGGLPSRSLSRETNQTASIVASAGIVVSYYVSKEVQADFGLLFDVSDRFAQFSGTSDARLTQLQIGLAYAFAPIFKTSTKKQ